MKKQKLAVVTPPVLVKLDIGCGKNKREGFLGVDVRQFEGVDYVFDAGKDVWPFDDGAVAEVNCSHLLEHLKQEERIHFVNELYRVLPKGGIATIITPHWASNRAYGDMTHEWPPVSEMWFYYLSKEWRAVNAPHNDFYNCDFEAVWGYTVNPALVSRNVEYQQFALQNYKEAAQDIMATLTKK